MRAFKIILRSFAAFIPALSVGSVPALAQAENPAEAEEELILVSAARIPVPADEAIASISVLDPEFIESRGAGYLADALRAVPGLAVSRSGGPGQLTQLRLRGSEANHVLVLVDGVEAGGLFTGEADLSSWIFDDIAAVEVARGEQSALWGADAIGGVISVRTAIPSDAPSWTARLEAGEFETARASMSYAAPIGSGWLRFGASGLRTDGVNVSGLGGETDGASSTSFSLSGAQELSKGVRVEASARRLGFDGQFDSDVDFDGALEDVDRSREGAQTLARLALHLEQGGIWRHETALHHSGEEAESLADGTRSGRTLGQRWRGFHQSTARWGGEDLRHRLTGLAEYQRDRLKNDGGPGAGENQSRLIETTAFALDYGLSSGLWDASLSARKEHNDRFEDSLTWRAGLARDLTGVNGRVRFNAGNGVKNPGLFELFGFFPDFFQGNPDLKPERSTGWEIGFEQSLADGDFNWSAVWFQSELEDEIFIDFNVFPFTAGNATGQSKRRGLELEARWAASPELSLAGAASFLSSEADGAAEIRRPEELASLTMDWRPQDSPWRASLALDYVGEQTDTDFGRFQTVTLDPYALLGGRLSRRLGETAEIYLRGENLLDEAYVDVFGYRATGRGLYFGLRLGG